VNTIQIGLKTWFEHLYRSWRTHRKGRSFHGLRATTENAQSPLHSSSLSSIGCKQGSPFPSIFGHLTRYDW